MAFLSPAMDFTLTLPSQTSNAEADLMFPGGLPRESVDIWASREHVLHPELSPFRGDWSGFPPLYLCAGDTEVLLSDSLESAHKAHRHGVDVRCHVFNGLWHDWVTDHPDMPESNAVGAHLRDLLGLKRAGE